MHGAFSSIFHIQYLRPVLAQVYSVVILLHLKRWKYLFQVFSNFFKFFQIWLINALHVIMSRPIRLFKLLI